MKIAKRVSSGMILIFFLALTNHLWAQENFPNTLFLGEEETSPSATIDNMSWIAGYWQGEAFGGIVEEFWTAPSAGNMVCVFKLIVEGKTLLYELCTISEENNTLMMRLKHFNSKLIGWEDKDKSIDFPLVKMEKNKIYFDGLTFERISDMKITIYVVLPSKDGKKEEVKLTYTKVD
jgi:hypothetical protein